MFKIQRLTILLLVAGFNAVVFSQQGKSFYTQRLEDTQAIYVNTSDGKEDATVAIQHAINLVQEQSKFGIVFIPEGRYKITKTIHVWKGIRLIGYGKNRPTFVLAKNNPGFQEGNMYMVHFTSDKPGEGKEIRDANPGTFYSAISNINFEIQDGNEGAIAIRSHFAQHCYLAHIDFHLGSAKAGVDEVGNEIDDCRFFGGQYGIITSKPSPSWPFLMIDSYFEGQKIAAIETEEGGLTLVRNYFKNVPSAIIVRPDRAEELFMIDSRMENISGPAIIISDESNARPQYNLKNLVCENVPVLASFRISGKTIQAPGKQYIVKSFIHGNQIADLGIQPEVKTTVDMAAVSKLPEFVKTDIPVLPDQQGWVNLLTLGAKGDGTTDDTKVLQEAIEKYPTIYLPTGRYRVTETIHLKPNTMLVGLNPITSQIVLKDSTEAFQGIGAPKPLIEAPEEGTNIITGIGIDAGGINERAVGCKWMAGATSMINDVKFVGGHGTYNADGSGVPVYNDNRTADGNKNRKWDSQYWSLWVTNGGGGIFKNIWSASPYAQAGIYISNTSTKGKIYAISLEHHVRHEIQVHDVSNWEIFDIQMEEEFGESWHALPVELINCSNILFANMYLYRVDKMVAPFPHGVKINNSKNLEFCGLHVYSPTKFSYDNTIHVNDYNFDVRSREIANLKISGNSPVRNLFDSRVEKVVGGFEFIDATAVDSCGNVYFSDSRWNTIYRWSVEKNKLEIVCDIALSPLSINFDYSGNLLVVSKKKKVLSINPENPTDINELVPIKTIPQKASIALYPGHRWKDEHDFLKVCTAKPTEYYVSNDSTTIIPYTDDLWRAFTLRSAQLESNIYIADEFGQKTVLFHVNNDGSLSDPKTFAEEGELDVAVDNNENVYVAAGAIFVYDKTGKHIDTLEVPERPASLIFGGKDRKTLFVAARSALYKVEVK